MGFQRPLKQYQMKNVQRLLALPAGATFSVPGAGKTTEALAVYFMRRQIENRLLVVAPKNAFAVWEEQLKECLPDIPVRISRLQGGSQGVADALDGNPEIGIISYQQLPRVVEQLAYYLSRNPCFMILDESHRMKAGLDGVSATAILGISHLPVSKMILSGTPMPNSVNDLIAQFNFLYPEVQVTDSNIVEQLRRIYVRTTKDDLGLEPAHRIRHRVDLSAPQRRLYSAITSDAARLMMGLRAGDRVRLRAISRCVMHLIQAASDPSLLASSDLAEHPLLLDAIAEPSPKIVETCRIARDLSSRGHKSVIWSYFVQTVEHLAGELRDLKAEYIHGGVDTTADETVTDSREAKIRRFHDDPTCMVLVANPAACSESISLHKVCHHAIYVDRTYNAAQYLQSEDRIHRLGLGPTDHTYITILHSPDTIDDSIDRRLESKVAAMSRVLNDRGLNIQPFDLSDESDGLDWADLEDIRQLLLGDK
jgi:SNF2 family DNA or RNA helicase